MKKNDRRPTMDRSPAGSVLGDMGDADSALRWQRMLMPLASLKLTVALLAMAIFLVFAGTLAQVDQGIWVVVSQYFRTPIAWIDVAIFLPRDMPLATWCAGLTKPLWLPFPGGFLIGGLMAINLLAAQLVRFKVQTGGWRLATGLPLIALGVGITYLVVVDQGPSLNADRCTLFRWITLWRGIQAVLVCGWLAVIYRLATADRTHRVERRIVAVVVLALAGVLAWLFWRGDPMLLSASSMRILWQLIQGGVAGLVLLAGCGLLFGRRAGIVLLHAGIVLMMANEVVVYRLHDESRMTIREGQTVNFTEDIRQVELAIAGPAGADGTRQMVVVPAALLRGGQRLERDPLPFGVQLVAFFPNASPPHALAPGKPNRATAGFGLRQTVDPLRAGVGSRVDMPAAYVRFFDRHGGEDLGTYLCSTFLADDTAGNRITADGRAYEVSLRFKRNYKPYSMQLIDVRADKYPGTEKARNYSSDIRLRDPTRHEDRQVRIWMNNPLRYAGETFYQSGVEPADDPVITVLQVVANTAWMIPYVACMLVGTGMLAHFVLVLVRFLGWRRELIEDPGQAVHVAGGDDLELPAATPRRRAERYFPWAVVVTAGLLVGFCVVTAVAPDRAADEAHLREFGALPVVYEGRTKPFDTLARNSLCILSGKQTYVDPAGRRQPAIRWLLDVITDANRPAADRVFKIANLDVLEMLGLQRRAHFRYALDEFRDRFDDIDRQSRLARAVDGRDRSVYQKQVLALERKLRLLFLLREAFRVPELRSDHIKEDLTAAGRRRRQLAGLPLPLAIPPAPDQPDAAWEPYTQAVVTAWARSLTGKQPNPATRTMMAILAAYQNHKPRAFNREVAAYRARLAANPPADYDAAKTDFEAFFNRMQPFLLAAMLYLAAFLLATFAWLGWSTPLNRAAFRLLVLTLVLHTLALAGRVYISGRPPVTNLYSSAVFLGWGCVLFGLILERMFRLGIGNVVAAVAGFTSLLIAHFLAGDGDTLAVLQAVLDTQFWLATHVTCITLGYSATFIAGLLGVLYLVRGIFTPSLTPPVREDLSRMIYGTLCFALLLSFVGTVLGGLWADDSWGRFWGWDPKENGALIIVLWNALVLHARWDRMVGDRGLAVLAVGGNITTSWSWFGVNQLGAGLHSYGFTEGVALVLVLFVGSQLVLMGLGALLPERRWTSFRRSATARTAT